MQDSKKKNLRVLLSLPLLFVALAIGVADLAEAAKKNECRDALRPKRTKQSYTLYERTDGALVGPDGAIYYGRGTEGQPSGSFMEYNDSDRYSDEGNNFDNGL